MLLLLAWMLWLYRRPADNDVDDGNDLHPNAQDIFVTSNIGQTKSGPPDEKPFQPLIIEEEIFQLIDNGVHQSAYNDQFDDFNQWDLASSDVKEARILKQQSIVVGSQGNEACVIDERNQFVGTEAPFVEAKKATLASQQNIKRDRAKLYSPNSSFTPVVKRSTEEKGFLTTGDDDEERQQRPTSRSSMNILIRRDTIVAPNEVSCFEGELQQNNRFDIHPYHMEDEESDEDNEVAQAFLESRAEPEGEEDQSEDEMQYTLPHGTKVTINNEPAGRIHSIVVKDKKQQLKPKQQKSTKIRIASPRIRATSPRVRAENVSPTIVSISQDELVHLVVDTSQPDANVLSREHVIVPEPIITAKETPKTFAKPKPPTPTKPKPPSPTKKQNNVGKLPPQSKKFKDPNFLEKQKKQVTDFDAIMNKRKKFVDTMDDAGRLLGQIAHRDEKLAGGRRQLSKHWLKIKDAVQKRQYLKFNDKPMR